MRAMLQPAPSPAVESRLARIGNVAIELIILACYWYAFDALKYLRLSVSEFVWTFSSWLIPTLIPAILPRLNRSFGWLRQGGASLLGGAVLIIISPHLRHPVSLGAIGYAIFSTFIILLVWRTWSIPGGVSIIQERMRRLLIILIPLILVIPYFTDQRLGGVDGLWYYNMLKDFVTQSRAGVFPVFIGQGFEAYNGPIHPFRSGPMFLWLGGTWDILTFRSLAVFSLQHLTVITAALFGSFASYLCFTSLRPKHRWAAVTFVLIYLSAPGILKAIYCDEMYMTWMAIAVLPIVVYANARILLRNDSAGWTVLAVGLAAIWMCHPPVALITMLCTAFMQVIGVASRPLGLPQWMNIGKAAVLFALLSGYYFISMAEVPPRQDNHFSADLASVFALFVVVGSAVGIVYYRKWIWAVILLPALIVLSKLSPAWLVWAVFFLSLVILVRSLNRGPFSSRSPGSAARAVFFAGIGALIVGWFLRHSFHQETNIPALILLDQYRLRLPHYFLPVSAELNQITDCQPGWAVWACLFFGFGAWWVFQYSAIGVLISVCLLIACCFVRIPAVSDFLVGYSPIMLTSIFNFPLNLRLLPPCVALASFSGFLSWSKIGSFRGKVFVGIVLILAVLGCSLSEGWKFMHRGFAVVADRPRSNRIQLSENMKVERFVYDLLPLTPYFSNNPTDARLENRTFNLDNQMLFDADVFDAQQEKIAPVRQLSLYAEIKAEAPQWFFLKPALTVRAGEDLLLRFVFQANFPYTGILILESDVHDYREYLLDQPGSRFAFSPAVGNSKVISLWNSSKTDATYQLIFLAQSGQKLLPTEKFADLFLTPFERANSDVQLESLIPFQATVRMQKEGIFETERTFIPGYKATVDGKTASVYSHQGLATINLQPGFHHVVLQFVGTTKLKMAALLSGISWIFLATCFAWRTWFKKRETIDFAAQRDDWDADEINRSI